MFVENQVKSKKLILGHLRVDAYCEISKPPLSIFNSSLRKVKDKIITDKSTRKKLCTPIKLGTW